MRQRAIGRSRDVGGVIEEKRGKGHTSLRQIAAGLNELEIGAPRGGTWRVVQVANLLKCIAVI